MPRLKRRAKTRHKRSKAIDLAIATLDLPEELKAELLGVPKYSDYIIRLALDGGWTNTPKATEQERRAAWRRWPVGRELPWSRRPLPNGSSGCERHPPHGQG